MRTHQQRHVYSVRGLHGREDGRAQLRAQRLHLSEKTAHTLRTYANMVTE